MPPLANGPIHAFWFFTLIIKARPLLLPENGRAVGSAGPAFPQAVSWGRVRFLSEVEAELLALLLITFPRDGK